MKIDRAIANANTVPEILDVLEHGSVSDRPSDAKIYISFFGYRQVTVEGYEGSVNLAAIISRVLTVSEQMNYAFSDEERIMGERIVQIIERLYEDSDKQKEDGKLWWITKIIIAISYWIENCNPFPSSIGIYANWFDYGRENLFELYGREQYMAKVGKEPTNDTYSNTGPQRFPTWKLPRNYKEQDVQGTLSTQRSGS
jgi:hypothetical protein